MLASQVSDSRPSASLRAGSGAPEDVTALERDAALPGDEVVLAEQLGLGEAFAARHLNAQVEQLLGALRGSSIRR